MSYIIKNNGAIINTRLTDVGRRKLSQGNFNISYFQIGDSEVCYNCVTNLDEQTLNILTPQYNGQNNTGIPQSNKSHIKYPFYLDPSSGTTWGIPFENSGIDPFFNQTISKGPFSGNTFQISTAFTISSNYSFSFTDLIGGNDLQNSYSVICDSDETPEVGQIVALFYDPNSGSDCGTISGSYMTEFYTITGIGANNFYLDRPIPNFDVSGITGDAKIFIYPSGFTPFYDSITSEPYWPDEAFAFDLNCTIRDERPLVWNLSIPWSEDPAGLWSSTFIGYNDFASKTYLGTKEYLGYQTNAGQSDTDSTYYFNSFSEKIVVTPENQKCIGIIHYTNNEINNNYGEKFATEPFDPSDSGATGQARNLRIKMPLLMWHKNPNQTIGETFYIDPPGFDNLNLLTPYYIRSNVNNNMNEPGLRYYHLWDTHANTNGMPNRVGKVWPDLKIVTIDDEELIASMSWISKRTWTLPAPRLSLTAPNLCNVNAGDDIGIITGTGQTMWVTYIFDNDFGTAGMNCNYFTAIQGTDPSCPPDTANVGIRFNNEFPFLNTDYVTTPSGFCANEFYILAQLTNTGERPEADAWRKIDFTSDITMVNDLIPVSGITGQTFFIGIANYEAAPIFNLNDFIPLIENGSTRPYINFGDEYMFFGNVETDIQATVYEMRYYINLPFNQFTVSTNPTLNGDNIYVSEIGLYDSDYDLMFISKLESPQLREGVQQFLIKYDF